ncbi:MAG: hypothetical protein ACYS8I_07750 [Planctomycetota bacterium]|jgi:hypothetical protein
MGKRRVFWMVVLVALSVSAGCSQVDQSEGLCQGPKAVKQNFMVFSRPDRFAAWPANNGVWSWGDEILVGFTHGRYKVKESHDIEKPQFNVLGRSKDGGVTWEIEDPENYSGDDVEPEPSPGGINFAHRDFTMRVGGESFFISYDRGKNWRGPYLVPDGLHSQRPGRLSYLYGGKKARQVRDG